jgi:6-phosphogluconolactonase
MGRSTHVYVGTYTRHGRSEGIYIFRLDMATGALTHVSTVGGVPDPSWLAFGPDAKTLYAVNEIAEEGGVSAFAVDSAGGQLRFLNRVASHGAHPAHLSVDSTGRWVLMANYTGGTIATLPIQPDGALGEAADVVRHAGSGPNQGRQEGPHPHMIVTDPNGRFVLVPDLGLDAVLAYRLDGASGRLVAQPDAGGRVKPGAGPRHLAFGASGRHMYVINELDSTLAVFAYDAESGHMRPVQTVSTLPDDYSGESTTAAVVVAPSGRFVYGSNRGHDSVAAFAVDQGSGQLTLLGHTPTGGRTPRDVNLDPTGTFLLAANQNSDSITTFRVDARTGALEPTGHVAQAPSPVRVLFGPPAVG